MKTIYVILFSLSVSLSFAQMRGGGMGRGQGHRGNHSGMQSQQMKAVNVEKMAGIVTYDEDKVLKKLKIKNPEKAQKIRAYIRAYNQQMQELKLKHHKSLQEAKAMAEARRKEAREQQNPEIMKNARYEIKERLAPVRKEAKMHQKQLDEKMKSILKKKKMKKWKRYVASRKKNKTSHSSYGNKSGSRGRGKGMGKRGMY